MARSGSETTMPQSRAATRYLPPSATPQPANRLLAKPRHGRLRLPPARGGTRLGFLACCAPDFINRTIDLRRARALDLGREQNGPKLSRASSLVAMRLRAHLGSVEILARVPACPDRGRLRSSFWSSTTY